jgi:hypothetical protein
MTEIWEARLFRCRLKCLILLVQLGGLEPPTSCSTDRRSNQLSYNCIGRGPPLKEGCRTGRKLGATPGFGKAKRGSREGKTHPAAFRVKALS